MIDAPVGFHCPVCVAASGAAQIRPRSRFGGRVQADSSAVTRALLIANLVIFGFTLLLPDLRIRFGLQPVRIADGEAFRLLTAPFLHAGLLHLALNMYALWVLGSLLEPLLGRGRFVALYVTSALGGSALSYAFLPVGGLSLGASGAVYGLLGATFVVLHRLDRDVTAVTVILGINLVLSFVLAGIDWRAHLGGLVVGTAVAAAYAYAPSRLRGAMSAATIALAVIATLWLVSWRTAQLGASFPGVLT